MGEVHVLIQILYFKSKKIESMCRIVFKSLQDTINSILKGNIGCTMTNDSRKLTFDQSVFNLSALFTRPQNSFFLSSWH